MTCNECHTQKKGYYLNLVNPTARNLLKQICLFGYNFSSQSVKMDVELLKSISEYPINFSFDLVNPYYVESFHNPLKLFE